MGRGPDGTAAAEPVAPRRGRPRRVPAAAGAPGSVVEEIVARVEALVADNERLRSENADLHATLTQLTEALSGIAPRRRGRPRRAPA